MIRKLATACLAVPLCLAAAASAKTWVPTSTAINAKDLAGETHVLTTGAGSKSLNHFRMKFNTSDHEINALGFLPANDRVLTALSDQGGDDKYSFEALFSSNPVPTPQRKATGECDGAHTACKLEIKIPEDELGNVFLLQGFKFKRKGNNDANVRRVMVRGNLPAKRVEVLFTDNGKTPYSADVWFVTVPRSRFSHVLSATGAHKGGPSGLGLKGEKVSAARISGFDLEFENGDHHLHEFSIIPTKDFISVMFEDHNADDPFRATVDYAVYKVD